MFVFHDPFINSPRNIVNICSLPVRVAIGDIIPDYIGIFEHRILYQEDEFNTREERIEK